MNERVRPMKDDDRPAYAAVRNAVTPDWPTSPEEMAWQARTYPGGVALVAERDGRIVGGVVAGRIHVRPPDHPEWWADVVVSTEHRRGGLGTALLSAVTPAARAAGKHGLQVPASDDRPEGIAFLHHHGFVEIQRSRRVQLDLPAALRPPAPPAGIRLVTLAERPDLVPAVHGVAVATFVEIPGGDGPMDPGPLAEFRARDVDRPGIPPEAFAIALAGDEVVGYASLLLDSARPGVAYHDMTTVLRPWRGRGIGTALKAALIAWATDQGLDALETDNDEANTPMRALNARLGYRPLPDALTFRGPLIDRPRASSGR